MSDASDLHLRFTVNGALRSWAGSPGERLSTILRDTIGLTGVKIACEIGRCGACMVLLNGLPVNACLVMPWQIEGADVVTPEGLDRYPQAVLVKRALAEENAFQCGYCAPGFVVTLFALLRDNDGVTQAEIRGALEGNICRCTGYHSIIRGALRAAQMIKGERGVG